MRVGSWVLLWKLIRAALVLRPVRAPRVSLLKIEKKVIGKRGEGREKGKEKEREGKEKEGEGKKRKEREREKGRRRRGIDGKDEREEQKEKGRDRMINSEEGKGGGEEEGKIGGWYGGREKEKMGKEEMS